MRTIEEQYNLLKELLAIARQRMSLIHVIQQTERVVREIDNIMHK